MEDPDTRAAGAAGPAFPGSGPGLNLVDWLALREGADAIARAPELIEPLRRHLAASPPVNELLIRDLGAGTGSMLRWLAPRLPGAQRWILHERDPELLALAHSSLGVAGLGPAGIGPAGVGPGGVGSAGVSVPDVRAAGVSAADVRAAGIRATSLSAADGSSVTVVPQLGDLTDLRAADLAGTALLTASALLDVLTNDEVDQLAAACVCAECPALFALSVDGVVMLTPADDLDTEIADGFNAHQRRITGGRQLLGPDAVAVAADAFATRGAAVLTRPSPWRLGPERTGLTAEWLRGWVAAAVQWQPELAAPGDAYLRRRLDACAAGELRVLVQHTDLLALPGRPAVAVRNQAG